MISYEGERPQGDDVFRIHGRDMDYEFIPEARAVNNKVNILVYDQVTEAGQYEMRYRDDVLMGLSFNYDRRESDLSYIDASTLKAEIEEARLGNAQVLEESGKPVGQQLTDIKQGTRLWRLFLIFALAFLAVETLLLRFWR
jgi:hypothetical protein